LVRAAYFFSPGFDSLGELGEGVAELDAAPGAAAPAAPPAELDDAAPVPEVDASAPGAGEGVGVVVVVDEDEDDGAGAVDAGGVVTVLVSSFLQAVRPTATRAAMRSERFIFVL
jgi:hypothetical protein